VADSAGGVLPRTRSAKEISVSLKRAVSSIIGAWPLSAKATSSEAGTARWIYSAL